MSTVQGRLAIPISVRGFVNAFDQITSFLELNRQIERSRNVDAFLLDTLLIVPARGDLLGPEILPVSIALSIQEVVIMLADQHRRIIDRIRRTITTVVIQDLQSRS